ncbi:MAG: hypothetical protein NXI24_03695 [bacterium]|nr:hypothetical protein [bacterium]
MQIHKLFGILLVATLIAGSTACKTTPGDAIHTSSTAAQFNGTTTPDGAPRVYQHTTNYALHLGLGIFPIVGNATVESSVHSFTADGRKAGGSKVQITNMDYDSLWYILPPFSLIFTPVITDTYGYVYR